MTKETTPFELLLFENILKNVHSPSGLPWSHHPMAQVVPYAQQAISEKLKIMHSELMAMEVPKRLIEKAIKGANKEKGVTVSIPIEELNFILSIIETTREYEEQIQGDFIFFDSFLEAASTYFTTQKVRTETKSMAFLKSLGIKAEKRIDKDLLFWHYIALVFCGPDEERLEPWDALEELKEVHNLASANAALKHIQTYLTEQKKLLESEGHDTSDLKGILPGNP